MSTRKEREDAYQARLLETFPEEDFCDNPELDTGSIVQAVISSLPSDFNYNDNTLLVIKEQIKDSNPKDAIGDSKVPLWLLSPVAKAQWAVCQFVGLVKYGAFNWRIAGVRSSVYLSAMQRHMDAYCSGEELDPKDMTPHLGHVMACCAILIDAKAAGKLLDDRPPSVNLRSAYAEVEKQMLIAKENYKDMLPRHYTIEDTVKETK